MPWNNTVVTTLRSVLVALLWLVASALPAPALADSIESILAPGSLIQGHIEQENDCKHCHVKFDRKAQSGLCMDCHKPVGADVRAKTGFHGKLKPQACNSCHTDHKGRDADVVHLDQKKFDHSQTDYLLKGKHQPLECVKCHVDGKKFREAPSQCVACHKKDDTHKGSLARHGADQRPDH